MRQSTSSLVILALSLSLISCSSGKDSGSSPQLDLAAMASEGCLNLQNLTEHVNANFNFPARITTLNFSSSRSSKSLDAANFGSLDRQMRRFPFLRKAKQSGCDSVILETAYGRLLNYKIEASTDRSLHIIRSPSDVETFTDDVYKAAAQAEPEIKEMKITLTSPTSAIIDLKSDLFSSRCRSTKIPYQKLISVRWGGSYPSEEELDANYIQRIQGLLSQAPEIPFPNPEPTETPNPSPQPEAPPLEEEDSVAEVVPPDPTPTPAEGIIRPAWFSEEPAKTKVQVQHLKDTHRRILASFPGGQCH